MSQGASSPSLSERSLDQSLLSIHFVVVGGGISGLCSAITLSRVGHEVTLIEADENMDETPLSAGAILPPNMVKLLKRWDLAEQLQEMTAVMPGFEINRFDTGEYLGTHAWSEELFREAGGELRTSNYSAFRKMLKDTALKNGVTIRMGTRVTSVSSKRHTQPIVTLDNGEVLRPDVVIGADGLKSVVRQYVRNDEEPEEKTYLGMDVYLMHIPGDRLAEDPELKPYLEEKLMRNTYGHKCGAYMYLTPPPPGSGRQYPDIVFHIFLAGEGDLTDWKQFTPDELLQRMGEIWHIKAKMIKHASMIVGGPIFERPVLEDWVSEEGRVIVIGDAAHLFYPGAIQNMGVAVCDAATFGAFFRHLHHHRQIDAFLDAFAEIRPERIQYMRTMDFANLDFMMMPNGEEQELRDSRLRQRVKKGLNALDADGVDDALNGANVPSRWEAIVSIFCYDAEEEADKWWANWGSLQERASFSKIHTELRFDVQSVEQTVVVEE